MDSPFIVFGLPRSRTYWLSRFLSFGDYECSHEQVRFIRSMDDVRAWLSQDCTGTAETAAAPWWRLVRHFRPDIRVLVVRRAIDDVVESLMRLDMRGVCQFDRPRLRSQLARLDRYLDVIEHKMGNVLSVEFDDLGDEQVCAHAFEHCLPYRHDVVWWASMAAVNMQADMPALMRYISANRPGLLATAGACRKVLRRTLGARLSGIEPDADGVIIQREPLATFERDGQALMRAHCVAVGEPEDQWRRKNWPLFKRLEDADAGDILTARLNGRMLGYLTQIVAPSLEDAEVLTATQLSWFVSPDATGLMLGWRLQSAAIAAARARGVGEVYQRAGVRGDGPRLGRLYQRMGAEEFGALYKLTLKAA